MKCQFCAGEDTQVLESRVVEEGDSIRRRRECLKCHRRFTTYERSKKVILWVVKKDGGREPFDREKVKRGILRAIQKRPVSLDLVDDVAEGVEKEMLRLDKEEVPSKKVGRAVLARLKKVDKVAWLRFASVYFEFEGLDDFEKVIQKN